MADNSTFQASESVRNKTRDGEKAVSVVVSGDDASPANDQRVRIPLRLQITAVLLVSAIGFGAHWSSGVTGAMKSTLKKVKSITILLKRVVHG